MKENEYYLQKISEEFRETILNKEDENEIEEVVEQDSDDEDLND